MHLRIENVNSTTIHSCIFNHDGGSYRDLSVEVKSIREGDEASDGTNHDLLTW